LLLLFSSILHIPFSEEIENLVTPINWKARIGASVVFVCKPALKAEWKFNANSLPHNAVVTSKKTSSKLTLKYVDLYNIGNYSCGADSRSGTYAYGRGELQLLG